MARFFGLQIEPSAQSAFQHDYWEEFTKVNDVFAHEPDLEVTRVASNSSGKSKSKDKPSDSNESRSDRVKRYIKEKTDAAKGLVFKSGATGIKIDTPETELSEMRKNGQVEEKPLNLHMYPELPEEYGISGVSNRGKNTETSSTITVGSSKEEEPERFVSVAVQTEMSYLRDVEDIVSTVFI